MMKRGLPPELVITMASAHSAPTSGNQFKVVNWLRAGAILAQIDAFAQGYLYSDSRGGRGFLNCAALVQWTCWGELHRFLIPIRSLNM